MELKLDGYKQEGQWNRDSSACVCVYLFEWIWPKVCQKKAAVKQMGNRPQIAQEWMNERGMKKWLCNKKDKKTHQKDAFLRLNIVRWYVSDKPILD